MANKLAAAAMKKAAELKSKSKPQPSTRETKKVSAKKTAKSAKTERKSSVPKIEDAKGHEVSGRGNSFVCPEKDCKKTISGPWTFKMHLVNKHGWSRKDAGLRG